MTFFSSHKKYIAQGGFSVIEILVYIVILSLVFVALVASLLRIILIFREATVYREVLRSGVSAMERLTQSLHDASEIDIMQSTFGTESDVLELDVDDDGGGTTNIRFDIQGGQLVVSEDGSAIGTLTSRAVSIDLFTIENITLTDAEAVRISLGLSATQGNVTVTRNFYSTVMLRGSLVAE